MHFSNGYDLAFLSRHGFAVKTSSNNSTSKCLPDRYAGESQETLVHKFEFVSL
jgi:hypothetical protein